MPQSAATLTGAAFSGITIVAGTPSREAAAATPWAWLPLESATTPRSIAANGVAGERVVGAAELERAGALQAFGLDIDVTVEREPKQRGAHRNADEQPRCGFDVGERDGKRWGGHAADRSRRPAAIYTLPRVSSDEIPVELHIVSDSTGETAARLVLALEAQFPEQPFAEIRHPRVESVDDLQMAVATARGRPAVMVYTLVEPGLRNAMRQLCRRARVHYCDLLGHPIDSIARVSGMAARMTPGARPPLDQTYFKRIEAIEFAVKYDDGVGSGLDEADVVLVGVSRTSKTPLSIYLGYLGHKAANVPVVKGIEPPAALFEIDPGKVVGLTIEAERLSEIRSNRVAAMGGPRKRYAGLLDVYEELEQAAAIHRRLGCPVLDVSDFSVEETAMRVIKIVADRHRERRTSA